MTLKLIIFAKNLIEGNVKTRIAKKMGTSKALEIYKTLLINTLDLVQSLPVGIQPVLYFSEKSEEESITGNYKFKVMVQEGKDLGERMFKAFENEFESGFSKVCLIGTDIYDLDTQIIIQAFENLEKVEVSLGPALDGGYYLIGMKQLYPEIFIGVNWGQSTVLNETIERIHSRGIGYNLLPVLKDVDEYEDIPQDLLKKLI